MKARTTARPRTSRTVSGSPCSVNTPERREKTGVVLPTRPNTAALLKREMSCVTVKWPYAPVPSACTLRAGIFSRSNCWSFSTRTVSWSRPGPWRPAVSEFLFSAKGQPVSVVRRGAWELLRARGCSAISGESSRECVCVLLRPRAVKSVTFALRRISPATPYGHRPSVARTP